MAININVLCVMCSLMIATVAMAKATVSIDQQLISSIDDLDQEKSLPLFGGLSIQRIGDGFPSGPRSADVTILERAVSYLQSHEFKLTMSDDQEENVQGVFSAMIGFNRLFSDRFN